MTAAARFASWALGLTLDDVPAAAVIAAKQHILDGVGCALGAARANEAPYVWAMLEPGDVPVLGDGAARASVRSAAFANGALMHALDYDDTHADALVHATSAVLPAVLAVGAVDGVSGRDALTAAIAGYEIVCRLGAAVRHGFHARGFHATSVCGTFASALVTAKLLGLDEPTTVNALGLAGSFASGSLEFLATGSATKQIHPGWSAQAGVAAAQLAAAGADGPDSIFEGEHGLFSAYTATGVSTERLVDGLGERWEVERITIKPYPACQLSHASLDALLASGVTADRVRSITFDVPADAVPIVCEPRATKLAPRTSYEGKFSLPYSAAALLADGGLGIEAFSPDAIARADVLGLAAKVTHRTTEPGVAAADAPGRVEVTLDDGSTVTGEVAHSRGGPDAPLTDAELRAKFEGNGGSRAIADALLSLERVASVTEVIA